MGEKPWFLDPWLQVTGLATETECVAPRGFLKHLPYLLTQLLLVFSCSNILVHLEAETQRNFTLSSSGF